ncbi:transmembrane protein 267 [Aplysia californica]|uniref:Transmembrane protein 267 n=1 Tax=Aplysia californica TaxID=6500 RepID=A0ABM1W332_APLCA|nr:transmembrane protein 267 [Aplysia californica]XP_035829075.1 transmembrane protein 267 [Aplysia californica]
MILSLLQDSSFITTMRQTILSLLQPAFPSPFVTVAMCCAIVAVCGLGDHLLVKTYSIKQSSRLLRALIDNSSHALIGGLSWAVVEGPALFTGSRAWLHCVLCTAIASAVDVDHFLASGTFRLEKALKLRGRPPFHNTGLLVLAVIVCWGLRGWHRSFSLLALMLLVGGLSHQLRDGHRRGLWVLPHGSSPPLSAGVYRGLIVLLALCARLLYCRGWGMAMEDVGGREKYYHRPTEMV